MFNNVTGFKKFLKKGVRLKATHHRLHAGWDEEGKSIYTDKDLGIREVSIVQTNAFALKTVTAEGDTINSWCNFPSAKESKVENNKITIYQKDMSNFPNLDELPLIPVLTYEVVE